MAGRYDALPHPLDPRFEILRFDIYLKFEIEKKCETIKKWALQLVSYSMATGSFH